jgi:hypothetical protein
VRPAAGNGPYWLNPTGDGRFRKQYFCLMVPGAGVPGGWVLAMYVMRQAGSFVLDVTGAVGTIPHANPYIVGNGQAKEDNQVIEALQVASGGRYHWLMDNFQSSSSRSTPPGYPTTSQYPPMGAVVADWSATAVTPRAEYVRGAFALSSSVPLRGAATKMTGSTCSNIVSIADPGSNAFSIASISNTPLQHMYDSTTRIYDMTVGTGGGVSGAQTYASTCGDGYTGAYTFMSTYNCYHSLTMVYVR